MKKLTVVAAGLGWELLEREKATRMAGIDFTGAKSVFPAVTCPAQATLRTALSPARHGMIANGWWSEELRKPFFWDQSAKLVKGERVWAARREAGTKVGLFFFQQSLGEDADVIVSPAPIHKHGGGMIMSVYTKPAGLSSLLEKTCGKFPLWRYWGPFASPKVGRACIKWFETMVEAAEVDEAYLYLPTLDYAAQRSGPESGAARAAFREFRRQLERIADFSQRQGAELSVTGDYAIAASNLPPVRPNVVLRREGLFAVRKVGGMAYPDFYASSAFAMCDHEVCVIYGEQAEKAVAALLSTGEFELPPEDAADACGARILIARAGSWCDYAWWTDSREAPDYAAHVDIHNKPGYDPRELFLFNQGIVKGTHGRPCTVARSAGWK